MTSNDDGPANSGTDEQPRGRVPTVSCSRCGREWHLSYELEELHAGNRALEQFALDHHRHTGHYPDDVTPWSVSCRQCPAAEAYLERRPARRFALTHARHTGHTVTVREPEGGEPEQVGPGDAGEAHGGRP